MSELNDLIERLYQEGVEKGGLKDAIDEASQDSLPSEDNAEKERLLRVVTEMGALLHLEDQPEISQEPPTDEARLLILNHWESMTQKVRGIRQHMQSLDQDIVKMQPWGNFDVLKVEQLAAHGCHVRFWTMASEQFVMQSGERWIADNNVMIVTQDSDSVHFVTVTLGNVPPQLPDGASEIEICPSPISTLIMLQTRDKDSLKKYDTLLGDYALCHYGEVYSALRSILPPGAPLPTLEPEHQGLRYKLQQLFKNKHQ